MRPDEAQPGNVIVHRKCPRCWSLVMLSLTERVGAWVEAHSPFEVCRRCRDRDTPADGLFAPPSEDNHATAEEAPQGEAHPG